MVHRKADREIEPMTGLTSDESAELARQQELHDEVLAHKYEVARSANFRPRNLALADLTRMMGKANTLRGASFQYNTDPTTDIRGAGTAAGRELIIRATALDIGERACQLCSLQEYCEFTPDELLDLVAERSYDGHIIPEVTARRARLANRVEANYYKSNNHLCATNAAPGRLRDDTM